MVFILFAVICHPLHGLPQNYSQRVTSGFVDGPLFEFTGYLHWSIVNPDPEEAVVVLQLEPDSGSSGAIYSNRIHIGAKSSLEGRSLVTLGNTDRYSVSLIQQNMRVDKNDILLRPISPNRLNIAVLTDDDDFSAPAKSEERIPVSALAVSNIRHRNVLTISAAFRL